MHIMSTKKRILVIGAGASGLTAIKACKEDNMDVVCYEKSGEFGGLWRYHDSDSEEVQSVMKFTVSNASKEMSAFSDFPPPSEFPSFLHHTLYLKYLEMYAEHFDLLRVITYFQEVKELSPDKDYDDTGKWNVTVLNLNTNETRNETFDGIMVCSGHHTKPLIPSFPNMEIFKGKIMHSHNYKTFEGLEGKKVLVVGVGNSAVDVAADASTVADKVYLSTRRGAWIYPRAYHKGKPMDVCLTRRINAAIPKSIYIRKVQNALNKKIDHERYGLKPEHSVINQHPTISDEIYGKILVGAVTIRRDIKEFAENGVVFHGEEDVSPIDVVIFCTGYQIRFPFIPESIIQVEENNKIFLYKNVFPPQLKHHTLAVIGLTQPTGALMPVFEMQSRWFAALMTDKCQLPSPSTMQSEVKIADDIRSHSYVQSARYTVEVSWLQYMDDIASIIGVKPSMPGLLVRNPKLFWICFFGPCMPYQYRLQGPHQWDGATNTILNYKNRMYGYLKK